MTIHLRKRKRLLQAVLLIGFLFVLVFFFYALIRYIAFGFFHYNLFSHELVILAGPVLLAALFYKPIDQFTLSFFRDVLLRSKTSDFGALAQLARSSRAIIDRTELANLVVNTFGDTWGVRTASVMILDPRKGGYRVISAFGLRSADWHDLVLPTSSPLIELLHLKQAPVEREQIAKSFSWQEANQIRHDFERLHASCVVPMMVEEELIGSINLLPKNMHPAFTASETKYLTEFSKEVGIAFRNASLYEEIKCSNEELMRIQSELLYSAQHSAISQLAVGIAHEIHNPLTIISGKAQILLLKKNKINFDPQVEEVLKTIVKQTKRAADITRKLLMFSETERSAKELVDFETLVNDTIALLSYQVQLDQIQVIKRFTHPVPKWYGNVAELREAFLNLFLNAGQAIGTKGTIEVSVRDRKEEEMIELKISDSGEGISEANLARVFQPFFTTREGATGLGLFVTQQIIRKYRGTIHAQRREKGGASFTVELPYSSPISATNLTDERQTASKPDQAGVF